MFGAAASCSTLNPTQAPRLAGPAARPL